jgi:hypothetical protein
MLVMLWPLAAIDSVFFRRALLVATFLLASIPGGRVQSLAQSLHASAGASSSAANAWLRPSGKKGNLPLWGQSSGLRVGLAPLPGPRGLLRVYAPYLGQPDRRAINFIAVEPIPLGQTDRGLSELEFSKLDFLPGKRFWSGNQLADHTTPFDHRPAKGWLEQIDGIEHLRVLIFVEPFNNGAHVYLRLSFRADRPHEVGVATLVHDDSAPLEHCIVTATMGNFARLRQLDLSQRSTTARELWPDFRGEGFTPHARFPLGELSRQADGSAIAVASPTEAHPGNASYAPATARHWRYVGEPARQSWRSERPDSRLEVQVNGRRAYWNSDAPIPGGVSFENFEMVAPFRQGAEFWFGVEPTSLNPKPSTE